MKRLVKVAKELNKGTTTIVEHLRKNGFELENRPTAKISEEMYNVLLRDFSKPTPIKQRAGKITIVSKAELVAREKERKALEEKKVLLKIRKKEEASKQLAAKKEKVKRYKPKDINQESSINKTPELKNLKIKGKIDLNKFSRRPTRRNDRPIKPKVSASLSPEEIQQHIIEIQINKQKKLTEYLIGLIPFKWTFTKADYTAELTEAVDFTLFDKVICGILQLDEVASLEQIGTILGMNVVDNFSKKQYLDPAEREILEEALELLCDYEMIETGDTQYSRCYLTETGKEYAEMGRKFKTTFDKKFTLYYDHFIKEHGSTKKNFINLNGLPTNHQTDFDLLDIELMQNVAIVQEPSVYDINPKQLKKFRNPKLSNNSTKTYEIELYTCGIVDVETKKLNIVVFEPKSGKIQEGLTKSLNQNETKKDDFILQLINAYHYFDITPNEVLEHQKYLISQQEIVDKFITEKKFKEVNQFVKQIQTNGKFVPKGDFINHLYNYLESDYDEVWLAFSTINSIQLEQLKQFINSIKTTKTHFFFLFPASSNINVKQDNCWILNDIEVQENIFGFIKNGTIEVLVPMDYPIEIIFEDEKVKVSKEVFYKSIEPNTQRILSNCKKMFGKLLIEEKTKELINRFLEIEQEEVTKQQIIELEESSNIFKPFTNDKLEIGEFLEFQNRELNELKQQFNKKFREHLDAIKTELINKKHQKIEDLDIVKTSIEKIEANFLKDEKELLELSTSIKNEIKKEQEVIKKRLLAKTYIIDTNVFVNRPDILNYISTDDKVVVSAKVIDELDYLKCNEEISQTVSNAIKNIQSALKRKQIKTDFGKKELLPDEFDKRSPDNLILSMAIMYEKKPETNTVLLTSDNGLQLKSETLGIKVIDLNTFLEESKKKNRINKDTSRDKNNRRRGSRNQNSRNNRKKR